MHETGLMAGGVVAVVDGQRRMLYGSPPAGVDAMTVAVKQAFGFGVGAVLQFSVGVCQQTDCEQTETNFCVRRHVCCGMCSVSMKECRRRTFKR